MMRTPHQIPDLIYLDYNATTPCDPRVIERMVPYLGQLYGNPANGLHRQGRMAGRAIDDARDQAASLIGARAEEIVFTSGATESNNLVILGLARSMGKPGVRDEIVISAVEHKAVILPCKHLQEVGFKLTVLPVDSNGRVSIEQAREAISDRTLLVSIQAANNEIGTLQPVSEVAEIAHEHGALVHTDAAQIVGKLPIDVGSVGVDFLSASAHKLYGPKGIGCLYIRGGRHQARLEPLAYGGGQENGIRPGTMNVPAIVGMGEACALAAELLPHEARELEALRDRFETLLLGRASKAYVNGIGATRLPNTSSLTFPGIDADALLLNLPDLALGTGSACTSGAVEPSHVLQAIGLSRDDAYSTVRVSFGRFTTDSDVEMAAASLSRQIHAMTVS